jgi:hypothetical protein
MAKLKTLNDLTFQEILAWKNFVDEKVNEASALSTPGAKKQLKYWQNAQKKIENSVTSRVKYFFGGLKP